MSVDLTLFWVIFFVLLTGVALNSLIVGPLLRVMQERATAVKSASQLAESAAQKVQAATAEFEAQLQAARSEVYREMDEKRRVALERRAELLAQARAEAEHSIQEASARLHAQAEAARAQLEHDAEALAGEIVERVLGRKKAS